MSDKKIEIPTHYAPESIKSTAGLPAKAVRAVTAAEKAGADYFKQEDTLSHKGIVLGGKVEAMRLAGIVGKGKRSTTNDALFANLGEVAEHISATYSKESGERRTVSRAYLEACIPAFLATQRGVPVETAGKIVSLGTNGAVTAVLADEKADADKITATVVKATADKKAEAAKRKAEAAKKAADEKASEEAAKKEAARKKAGENTPADNRARLTVGQKKEAASHGVTMVAKVAKNLTADECVVMLRDLDQAREAVRARQTSLQTAAAEKAQRDRKAAASA